LPPHGRGGERLADGTLDGRPSEEERAVALEHRDAVAAAEVQLLVEALEVARLHGRDRDSREAPVPDGDRPAHTDEPDADRTADERRPDVEAGGRIVTVDAEVVSIGERDMRSFRVVGILRDEAVGADEEERAHERQVLELRPQRALEGGVVDAQSRRPRSHPRCR
jgi:hypothetical protein